MAQEEAIGAGAQFDRAELMRGVWDAVAAGTGRIVAKELPGLARVVAFLPAATSSEPPWPLWARLFQWLGPSSDAGGGPWRVLYFAATQPRRFPSQPGEPLGPEHVNGGYTRPCTTEGIVVYREEEATRVLLHELLHAACLDEHGWPIPLREAAIETWAELFLVALVSKGGTTAAASLWRTQAQWVANTNWRAATEFGVQGSDNYAWRYLGGREQMYARLGVELPAARAAGASTQQSLRFTHPDLGI